jgi:hypothetical protein
VFALLPVSCLAATACSSSHRSGGEAPDADVPDAGSDGATVGDPVLLWPGSLPWDDHYWNFTWVNGMGVNGSTIGIAVSGICCEDPMPFYEEPFDYMLFDACACTSLLTLPWNAPEQVSIGGYHYQEVLEGPYEYNDYEFCFELRCPTAVLSDVSGFFTADNVCHFPYPPDLYTPTQAYPPIVARWASDAEISAGPVAFGDSYSFPFHGGNIGPWNPIGPYSEEGSVSIGVLWGPENTYPDYSQDVYFQMDRYGVDGVVENVVLETYPADSVFPDDAPPDFGIDRPGYSIMANGTFL